MERGNVKQSFLSKESVTGSRKINNNQGLQAFSLLVIDIGTNIGPKDGARQAVSTCHSK